MAIPALPREIIYQIGEESYNSARRRTKSELHLLNAFSRTSRTFCFFARSKRFKRLELQVSPHSIAYNASILCREDVACHVKSLRLSFVEMDLAPIAEIADFRRIVSITHNLTLYPYIIRLWEGQTCLYLRSIVSAVAPSVTDIGVQVSDQQQNKRLGRAYFALLVRLLSAIRFPLLETFYLKPRQNIMSAASLWSPDIFTWFGLPLYIENLGRITILALDNLGNSSETETKHIRGFETWASGFKQLNSLRIYDVENRGRWNPDSQLRVTELSLLKNLTKLMFEEDQSSDQLSLVISQLTKLQDLSFYRVRILPNVDRWGRVFQQALGLKHLVAFDVASCGYSQEEKVDLWCLADPADIWDQDGYRSDHCDVCTPFLEDKAMMNEVADILNQKGILGNTFPLKYCDRV